MAHYNTVFQTLTKILPRHEIDRLDRKYGQGDKRRKTSRYVQLIIMLMAQILSLKSLREIEQAQKSKLKKLYHLGVIGEDVWVSGSGAACARFWGIASLWGGDLIELSWRHVSFLSTLKYA